MKTFSDLAEHPVKTNSDYSYLLKYRRNKNIYGYTYTTF